MALRQGDCCTNPVLSATSAPSASIPLPSHASGGTPACKGVAVGVESPTDRAGKHEDADPKGRRPALTGSSQGSERPDSPTSSSMGYGGVLAR